MCCFIVTLTNFVSRLIQENVNTKSTGYNNGANRMYISFTNIFLYKIIQLIKMNFVYDVTISINYGQTIFDTNMDTHKVSSFIPVTFSHCTKNQIIFLSTHFSLQ